MTINIKGFEVHIGADNKANYYTLNIPKLKYFKAFELTKNAIPKLEKKALEIITESLQG